MNEMLLRDMLEEVRPFWPFSSAWVAVLAVEYDLARESMSMRWDVQGVSIPTDVSEAVRQPSSVCAGAG